MSPSVQLLWNEHSRIYQAPLRNLVILNRPEPDVDVEELKERRAIFMERANRELRSSMEFRKKAEEYYAKASRSLDNHKTLVKLATEYDGVIEPNWWSRFISTLRSKR